MNDERKIKKFMNDELQITKLMNEERGGMSGKREAECGGFE